MSKHIEIPSPRARFKQFQSIEKRRETILHLPSEYRFIDKEEAIRAGFILLRNGVNLKLVCVFCEVEVNLEEIHESLFALHTTLNPKCAYIIYYTHNLFKTEPKLSNRAAQIQSQKCLQEKSSLCDYFDDISLLDFLIDSGYSRNLIRRVVTSLSDKDEKITVENFFDTAHELEHFSVLGTHDIRQDNEFSNQEGDTDITHTSAINNSCGSIKDHTVQYTSLGQELLSVKAANRSQFTRQTPDIQPGTSNQHPPINDHVIAAAASTSNHIAGGARPKTSQVSSEKNIKKQRETKQGQDSDHIKQPHKKVLLDDPLASNGGHSNNKIDDSGYDTEPKNKNGNQSSVAKAAHGSAPTPEFQNLVLEAKPTKYPAIQSDSANAKTNQPKNNQQTSKKSTTSKKGKNKSKNSQKQKAVDSKDPDRLEYEKLFKEQRCNSCWERCANTLNLPCRHLNACEQCSEDQEYCSFCKDEIIATVKVYFS